MKISLTNLTASLVVLFFSQGCISTSEVSVLDPKIFPTVTGTDLQGQEKTFPDCLSKRRTILIVAFERWQQSLCDGWYKHIETYMKNDSETAYFEIPVIAEMNPFSRWFIHRGMKSGIKDPLMRTQVVTLHIDKEPFKEALSITTEETIYVFVVDKKGEIMTSQSGEWHQEKWQQILSAIK